MRALPPPSSYDLYHYGVKGMKWGVRRYQNEDGTLTEAGKRRLSKNAHNEGYSDKQRKTDRALYGNRAEKRINRKLNEGYGLRGARHFEVERKEKRQKRKRTAKKIAKAVGSAAVAVGSAYVTDQLTNGGAGTRAVKNLGKTAINLGKEYIKYKYRR